MSDNEASPRPDPASDNARQYRPPQQGLTTRGPNQGRLPVSHRKRPSLAYIPQGPPESRSSTAPKGPREPPPDQASPSPVPPSRQERPAAATRASRQPRRTNLGLTGPTTSQGGGGRGPASLLIAPPTSAAAPPFQAGHGGTPPGLRSHHQSGEAQQPRCAPPSSHAPQINHVAPHQASTRSTASWGPRPDKTAEGPPNQRRASPILDGAAREPLTAPQQPCGSPAAPSAAPPPAQPTASRARHFTDSPRHQVCRFTNQEEPGPFTNASSRGAPTAPLNQEKCRISAPNPAEPHTVSAILLVGHLHPPPPQKKILHADWARELGGRWAT
ncbi:hypothetical protein NDU88_006125 [Pleurodeles waltl]|uniref:Uncharacterized protein n=1 Tax=Pleurodeles waltl TaxID=8319 RepID=A0AAV7LN60_PLEWA|nr:hypothetical protein NDU88_006125 [Pleurodeles waltl]